MKTASPRRDGGQVSKRKLPELGQSNISVTMLKYIELNKKQQINCLSVLPNFYFKAPIVSY